MLHLHPKLRVAWYAGTEDLDPMYVIIRRVRKILSRLDLEARSVCAYGSSAGGFAGMRMAALMPGMAAISANQYRAVLPESL